MTLPSKSPITLPFGATSDPYSPGNPHRGTDFAHIPDDKIYAPFTGKVILQPGNGKDGNGIYMYHPNGDFHGMLHSSRYLVPDGSNVSEGQAIAIMGETGYAFGIHLHWCIKRNGAFIDPMGTISSKGVVMTKDALIRLHRLVMGSDPGPQFISAFEGQPPDAALKQLEGDPNHLLMTPDTLTRLHRLALGSDPGPNFISAFEGGALVPALKQLEGDPGRLNAGGAQKKLDQIKGIVG